MQTLNWVTAQLCLSNMVGGDLEATSCLCSWGRLSSGCLSPQQLELELSCHKVPLILKELIHWMNLLTVDPFGKNQINAYEPSEGIWSFGSQPQRLGKN